MKQLTVDLVNSSRTTLLAENSTRKKARGNGIPLIKKIGLLCLLIIGFSAFKANAANATLNGLTISAGSLSPAFAVNTFNYTAQVSSSTGSITVTPTQTLSLSTITVNGIVTVSGVSSLPILLNPGTNTITIVVSKLFNTTKTYTITVTQESISYSGSPYTFYRGTAITTQTPTVTDAPTSYSISPALPAGLSFSTSTGAISGTPTASSASTTYTVTANYGGSITATTTISITVITPSISYSGSPYTFYTYAAITPQSPTVTGSPTGYAISPALPAGLSFDVTTGTISGTPTAITAAATYTITATYAVGVTASTTINITVVLGPPIISYSPSANSFIQGNTISSLTPTNTGGTAASYSITPGLPGGLSFNTSTGVISGTPTGTSSNTTYTITATNTGGSNSTTITIIVNPQPPVISYAPVNNTYTTGSAISALTPTNTGGAATSYSVSPALPAGISINTTTGKITGTPTAVTATTAYTVTATNGGGSGTATINITVAPPAPNINYTPNNNTWTVGTTYTLTPTNTGGADTIWAIGPALPAGLSFDSYTGIISGSPTAASSLTTYTISGTNDGGTSTTTVKIKCVMPSAPAISYTPSTNVYTTGTTITSLTPTSTGGPVASYSISATLPTGLSFSTSTGVISGTPSVVSAITTYTITATNVSGSATTTVTITVNPPKPVISYSPSTNVYTVGTAITALTPTNTGGTAASYSISPALSAGLSFSTSTGVISGTPTATSAAKTYTITATNASGSGTATVNLTVNASAPTISYSPNTLSYSVGTTITPASPVITGGTPSSYTITGGTLPTGLLFNTTTGVFSGTPTQVYGTTTFTVTGTNAYGSSSCSVIITVSPSAPNISYTPSTNVYTVNSTISTLTPNNTGGAVTGYTYSTTGVALNGATLSGPSLMTIDASGNIYVANYNNRSISKWNSSHVYQGTYTTGVTFTHPEGIVFDSAGNCYVEDTGAGAIYKFNSTGAYVSTIITGLNHPLGISIDASDNLYIATYVYTSPYASSVTEYTTAGVQEQTLPTSNMNESDGVAVDQNSGIIYVLNRGNNLTGTNQGYVTYYSSTGTYLGTFSTGYNDPLAISVDPSGNVFVADSHNNQVKIYSSNGVLLNTLSGFTDVEGFVADGNGNLYVSDFTNNTVKEYAALGGYHISAPLPPGLTFSTTTGQISGTPTTLFSPTTWTITAYNITGSSSTTVTLSCVNAYDWIGATSTDWNTASNWLSGVVPGSSNTALVGVNRTFNYYPNVSASDGTVNVGAIQFGNVGGKYPGAVVNTGGTLNVLGAITYQSDASSGLGYTCTLSGAGTLTADSVLVIANTTLPSTYTATMASSVTNLSISGNISLTSSESSTTAISNATFNVTGGTTALTGVLETSNTTDATSTFAIVPASTATFQISAVNALSGLSSTGTNVVTFNNTGATVNYAGAAQTIYTDKAITGLANGVSYQSIAFSGTGIPTAGTGNLNIAGDFTITMANDATNFVKLYSPTVNFNGTTQTLDAGPKNGVTFIKATFSGAGTKTMTNGKFFISPTGKLTMSGTNPLTVLNANGFLTLMSSSVSSASVATMSAGPSITGNVTVQRYLTGGAGYRGYRMLSSPVYAGTVGTNNVYSLNYLKTSAYLTGTAGGGFDKAGNPTIYLFREDQTPNNTGFTNGNFWGISAINNTPSYNYYMNGGSTSYNLPAGNGYMFFFRGNRASATVTAETTVSYVPVSATIAATGVLNQGQVTVSNWYTPGSQYLGYTGSGTSGNFAVRGFNLVGNPYASSIDWESYNTTSTTTGIYASNISTTVYELNPATNNYDIYQVGGIYTNHASRTIVSGEGFFVLATGANAQLIFNESAKTTSQLTGLNLYMDTKQQMVTINKSSSNIRPHIRLQMAKDSINTDDTYIGFDNQSSSKYQENEDAPYKIGNGQVSLRSFSADSVMLAINKMAMPGAAPTNIPLFVTAKAYGTYKLNMTELDAIPQIYEVWLMDKFNKDSLDMRNNPTYTFDITTDTGSYGRNRFQLVIRQNAALAVHLLSFGGQKVQSESQIVWKTENEQNYTSFAVERSTDGGHTFSIIGSVASNGDGTYSLTDRSPVNGADEYRLQMTDLNGVITYSNVVTIMYGNTTNSLTKTNIIVYPNPTRGPLNLNIDPGFSASTAGGPSIAIANNNSSKMSYGIQIVNILGTVVNKGTSASQNWQTDVSTLPPGTYFIKVINAKDNSLVGESTFVKL